MEANTVTSALSTLTEVVTSCLSIITGSPILMVCFVGCIAGVGFGIIRMAKHAANS